MTDFVTLVMHGIAHCLPEFCLYRAANSNKAFRVQARGFIVSDVALFKPTTQQTGYRLAIAIDVATPENKGFFNQGIPFDCQAVDIIRRTFNAEGKYHQNILQATLQRDTIRSVLMEHNTDSNSQIVVYDMLTDCDMPFTIKTDEALSIHDGLTINDSTNNYFIEVIRQQPIYCYWKNQLSFSDFIGFYQQYMFDTYFRKIENLNWMINYFNELVWVKPRETPLTDAAMRKFSYHENRLHQHLRESNHVKAQLMDALVSHGFVESTSLQHDGEKPIALPEHAGKYDFWHQWLDELGRKR